MQRPQMEVFPIHSLCVRPWDSSAHWLCPMERSRRDQAILRKVDYHGLCTSSQLCCSASPRVRESSANRAGCADDVSDFNADLGLQRK